MKDRKTEQLMGFPAYDVDGLARHFEKRAAQGWVLDRFDPTGFHYHREEPRALHYAVFLDQNGDLFAPGLTPGQEEFAQYCAHDGWKLLTVNGATVICVSTLSHPKPLQTDPVAALRNLDRVMRGSLLYDGFLLAIGLLCLGVTLHRWRLSPLDLLLEPGQFVGIGLCLILFLLGLTSLGSYLLYRVAAGKAAKEGRWLPTRSPRPLIAGLYGILAVLVVGQFFAGEPPEQWGGQLLHLLLRVSPILLLYAVMHLLKQSHTDADTNRHISFGVYFVAALILLLFDPSSQGGGGQPLPELPEPILLTVSDLTGEADDAYEQDHYLWKSSSLVTESRASDAAYDGQWGRDTNKPELHYTQLDVHKPWVYDLCLRDLLHTLDWAREQQPDFRFVPLVPTPAGTQAAYAASHPIREDTHCYIFCLEDRLFLLQYSAPLTEDQLAIAADAFAQHQP